MIKAITTLSLALLLSACVFGVHTGTTEQLSYGMTSEEVVHILGKPDAKSFSSKNEFTYKYSLPIRGKVITKTVYVDFKDNKLVKVSR